MTGNPTPPSSKARRQKGLAIIELALTLPLLITVLSGIVQFGGLFFVQNKMINVARDVTRKLAIGDITSGQVNAQVQAQLAGWTQTFTTTTTMPSGSSKDCSVEIKVPKASVSLMDIFGMFKTGDLKAKVVMRIEDGT